MDEEVGEGKERVATHLAPDRSTVNEYPARWTILLTVNGGFYDFFQNWWAHYKRLNMTNTVVVVAEDDAVYAKLQSNSNLTVERSQLTDAGPQTYETPGYNRMVSTRAQHILRHLRAGEDVLYTDVDTVWRSDPTPHLGVAYDLTLQLDAPKYYCTGFMAVRSNPRTIGLFERWDEALLQKAQLNQPVCNKILQSTEGLRHAELDKMLFPNGGEYFQHFDAKSKDAVVVVHNNYIIGHEAKKKRFQKAGLWKVVASGGWYFF